LGLAPSSTEADDGSSISGVRASSVAAVANAIAEVGVAAQALVVGRAASEGLSEAKHVPDAGLTALGEDAEILSSHKGSAAQGKSDGEGLHGEDVVRCRLRPRGRLRAIEVSEG